MQQAGPRRWRAGWWPDPWGQDDLRWHDGTQWTVHAAPAPPTMTDTNDLVASDPPPATSAWAAPSRAARVATLRAPPVARPHAPSGTAEPATPPAEATAPSRRRRVSDRA